jgi:hypothetical protein
MKRLIAVAVVVLAPLITSCATPATASAPPLPKIQTLEFGTWHSGWKVRPDEIVFGSYFLIEDLRYSSYGQRSARATGRLDISSCQPDCAKAAHFVTARASFYGVFGHAGPGRSFGDLKLSWDGGHDQKLLRIDSRGQWAWN